MPVLFLWIVLAVIVAMVAHSKGRPAVVWFFYGLLIWPIALVHILLIRPETGTMRPAQVTPTPQPPADRRVKCPSCAEWIMADAKICRFCGRDVPAPQPQAMPAFPAEKRCPRCDLPLRGEPVPGARRGR